MQLRPTQLMLESDDPEEVKRLLSALEKLAGDTLDELRNGMEWRTDYPTEERQAASLYLSLEYALNESGITRVNVDPSLLPTLEKALRKAHKSKQADTLAGLTSVPLTS